MVRKSGAIGALFALYLLATGCQSPKERGTGNGEPRASSYLPAKSVYDPELEDELGRTPYSFVETKNEYGNLRRKTYIFPEKDKMAVVICEYAPDGINLKSVRTRWYQGNGLNGDKIVRETLSDPTGSVIAEGSVPDD